MHFLKLRISRTSYSSKLTPQADRFVEGHSRLELQGKTFGPVKAFPGLAKVLWVKEQELDLFERLRRSSSLRIISISCLQGRGQGTRDKLSLSWILIVSKNSLEI
jgi:hypothetical protein